MATPMEKAALAALGNIGSGAGGPFGAAIVKDGEVIAVAANSVLSTHDPTAHAEVNAIRKAAEVLGTHNLSGCEIYATGYPCPMCLSAVVWANIDKIYYANDLAEAAKIGFRDDAIYEAIRNGNNSQIVSIEHIEDETSQKLYAEYERHDGQMY